ncbi:MAG: T9SS type A sorting domain-containing protein [Bacteroidales bacterium]|nr:T9SS type A sorting domain-containing protein [Bacteroidales bacterium]
MKNKLQLFISLILVLLALNLNAQKLSVTNETKSSLSINLTIDDYDIKEIETKDATFHEVVMSNINLPKDKGKPELPYINRYVAIPQNAKVKIVVNSFKKEIIDDVNIMPSKGVISEYDLYDDSHYRDAAIYSNDEFYPKEFVALTDNFTIRGVDVVGLMISPTQYNPVTKELIVYSEINFSIEFESGDRTFGDNRLRSPHFDPILQHHILNYNNLPEIDYSERLQSWIKSDAEGAEYLIIIPDNESFREQAQRLADYRKKQGIITKVFSLGDINANSQDELRNWIVDAYNNWEIAPVAVCLLGDYDTNPTYGISAFTFDFNGYATYISDRPYSDIDNDLLPDIAISRLTAADASEAKIMVDKQINYEFANPVTDEKFYESPIMTCAFQMEKWFQISTESVNGYLSSIGKEPYRYTMHYYYGDEYNGDEWSSASNTAQVVNYFGPNGLGYIPSTPDELGGFIEYNSDEEPLLNKISQEPGYILLNRDHGWFSIWDCPHLSAYSIPHLTNYGKLPFVLSINCASGAFDQYNCLTEAFMRLENAGAVGVIAATYETHTYTNDSYIWGIWDFFENDFLPDYGTSVENNNNYMPAFANVSAKHFLYQQNFPNTYENTRELTSNLFHAHCDAFLKLYSEVPQQMDITHDDIYYYESHSFNIKAPHGSTICISTDDLGEIKTLAIAEGTGNMQAINIPNNVIPGNKLYITVTKPNHIRYEEDVVISTDKAFIMMYDFYLYEDSQEITLNQDTYLNLKLRNIGKENASSINFSLSCDSDLIDITNNNNIIANIGADEIVNVEDAFYLDIIDEIPNGSTITFTLSIEHNGTSHDENFKVAVNSYNFDIISIRAEESDGDGNGFIDPGEIAKFMLLVENNSNYDMENIVANLISNSEFIRVISKDIVIPSLNIGEGTNIEFEFYVEWNILPEPVSLTLEFDIDGSKIRHNFEKLLGTLAENFENGVIENDLWQNDFSNPWYVDSNEAYEGNHSLRSGKIGDESNTQLSITLETFSEQVFSFYYKVSSEEGWDYFYFYIDGEQKIAATGDTEWLFAEYLIPEGTHTYTWVYQKDFMTEDGNDCVWIDNILFPCSSFTDVNEMNNDDIRIYPNPANYFIDIEIENDKEKAKSIEIINEMGVTVIRSKFKNKIDVSSLSPGLYFIRINFKDYIHNEKVVIE